MPVIETLVEIRAPIERVFDLSRSIDLHLTSTGQTGERAVAGVTSGLISLGERVTWRAKHFGVWQDLTSQITVYDRPAHFRDSMVKGAFRRLDHDHYFTANGEMTVVRDVFNFEAPYGLLGRAANAVFLTRYMRRFLKLRNGVIKEVAEGEEWRRYLRGSGD